MGNLPPSLVSGDHFRRMDSRMRVWRVMLVKISTSAPHRPAREAKRSYRCQEFR